ncbi:MAG: nitroimidazol reductase NimA-like FMN-containing flavoprotein [Halioglobus sp.]|jgi:nitroimidazol reductase NimA-like FMN-containing flavoprotein (pyridoxamine 5'-phosphate oxidase superfamily)
MNNVYTVIDPIVKWILRSPLHSLLSSNTTLLEYVGNKSGRRYILPLSYLQSDNQVHLFTGREKRWWRNLRGGKDVTLLIRGNRIQGEADVELENLEQIAATLSMFLKASPRDAKPSKVRLDEGRNPNQDDVREAASRLVSITIDTTTQ